MKTFWKKFALARWLRGIVLFTLVGLGSFTDVAEYLDNNFVANTLFQTRVLLNKAPAVSDQLKIYFFDDFAARELRQDSLTVKDWSELIQGFAKAKPRIIMIHNSFFTNIDEAGWEEFAAQMAHLEVPVVISSYVLNTPRETGKPLSVNHSKLKIIGQTMMPPWLPKTLFPYIHTAPEALTNVISAIGYTNFTAYSSIAPFLKTSDESSIAHLSLFAAETIQVTPTSLILNGHEAPLDKDDQLLVNLMPIRDLQKASYSLARPLRLARKGLPASASLAGDTVVILDKMTSEASKFIFTPAGTYPSAFVVPMVVNSILTGEWLIPYRWPLAILFSVVLCGSFLGATLSPLRFGPVMCLGSFLIVGISLGLFSYADVIIPWFFPVLGFILAGVIEFTLRLQNLKEIFQHQLIVGETEQRILESTLILAQPPNLLRHIIHNIKEIEASLYFRPLDGNSGDWFWVHHDMGAHRLYLFIGDVTGHGVQASLVTLAVSGAIKSALCYQNLGQTRQTQEEEVRHLVFAVDSTIKDLSVATGKVMTMTIVALDLASGAAVYANCGHLPLIWLKQDKIQSLLVKGFPLGMNEVKKAPQLEAFTMMPGDGLILYTDGLVENGSASGKTLAHHRIKKLVRYDSGTDDNKNVILKAAFDLWDDQNLEDDCSLIVLKYLGPEKAQATG